MAKRSKSSRLRSNVKKACPSGKRRSSKTGRCRKSKTRTKSARLRSLKKKKCSRGKYRNSKTGRCIKREEYCPYGRRPSGRCMRKSRTKSEKKSLRKAKKLVNYMLQNKIFTKGKIRKVISQEFPYLDAEDLLTLKLGRYTSSQGRSRSKRKSRSRSRSRSRW